MTTLSTPRDAAPRRPGLRDAGAARELFWQNVIREFLTSLSVQQARDDEASRAIFDGRLAIITRGGARIPIGAVRPLFACGLGGTQADRELSMAVECSVFQIDTPEGEAFTLPLDEIRSLHALSAQLIEQIQAAANPPGSTDADMPFGFAAFTSLARTRTGAPYVPGFVGPDFALPE